MSECLIKIETDHKLIELTGNHLKINIKQELVENLKELTKSEEVLHNVVSTLLQWAHYPLIPVSDIVDVSTEILPVHPGKQELVKLNIKARYYGGWRIYEIYLNPPDAQKLASEIKKLIQPKF